MSGPNIDTSSMTSNELCKPYLHWPGKQSKNACDPLNTSRTSPVASLATVAPAHTAIKTYVNAVITIAKIVPFGIDVDGSYARTNAKQCHTMRNDRNVNLSG